MDMEQKDYDSRTALHVAAAEGNTTLYLKKRSQICVFCRIILEFLAGQDRGQSSSPAEKYLTRQDGVCISSIYCTFRTHRVGALPPGDLQSESSTQRQVGPHSSSSSSSSLGLDSGPTFLMKDYNEPLKPNNTSHSVLSWSPTSKQTKTWFTDLHMCLKTWLIIKGSKLNSHRSSFPTKQAWSGLNIWASNSKSVSNKVSLLFCVFGDTGTPCIKDRH